MVNKTNYSELMDAIADIYKEWLGKGWTSGITSKCAFFLIKEIIDKEDDK